MGKLFIIILISVTYNLYGQGCYKLDIQKSKEIKTSKFYFKTVLDSRNDTSKIIGEVYLGNLNIPQCAAFKKDLSQTVCGFLQKTYPNKNAPAYLVKVNSLYIKEVINKNMEDTGIVNANLAFYRYKNDNELIYITTISKKIEDKFPDATYSHDNRLKRVLIACVNEFNEIINKDTSIFTLLTNKENLIKTTSHPDSSMFNKRKPVLERFKVIMQLDGSLGWYTKAIGLKAGMLFFTKAHPKFGIGPEVFWNYINFTKNFKLPGDVSYVSYQLWNIGLNSFCRINKYLGITINGNLLFGRETITKSYLYYEDSWSQTGGWQRDYYVKSNTTNDFIGGFRVEQGIQFMRMEKRGVNAKLSIYENILTGTYYDSDIGLKLSVGVNF